MSDFYENDDVNQLTGAPIQPQRYNIVLTQKGEELAFDFPSAPADLVTRFGYVSPMDSRCESGLVNEEEDLYKTLKPIIGQQYRGDLGYHTRKQVIISLHDTAILGYQRQSIIDPRISNEIATFWEIYVDQRIFPQATETEWRELMAESIIAELNDENADPNLAEEIKGRILNEAEEDDL